MARSGPQYYPGASRAYWYEDNYGGSTMDVNACVLHTTEGTSLPSYGGGASAPNITAVPDFIAKKLRWYQHFRIDTSSRALVNLRGGPETNTLNVVQVELVGTCDPSTHRRWGGRHIFWPEAPDWALRDLGRFIGWLHREHGVRLSAPTKWLPYPSSYGRTSARMSASEWRGFYGICGHQHVVENDHGDPGAIDINRILAYARGEAPSNDQEDDVQLNDEVKVNDWIPERWKDKGLRDGAISVATALGSGYGHARRAGDAAEAALVELKALRVTVDKLADAVGAAGNFDPAELKAEIREAIESVRATVVLDVNEGN